MRDLIRAYDEMQVADDVLLRFPLPNAIMDGRNKSGHDDVVSAGEKPMPMIARLFVAMTAALAATPALATDLNTLRAAHKLPPLSHSAMLAAAAYEHAHDLARRNHLDHNGFKQRMGMIASTAAENVLYLTCARPDAKPVPTFAGRACGCADEACAFRVWAKSAGHRRNMLLKGVSHYGLASATADNGRVYWVLELGN